MKSTLRLAILVVLAGWLAAACGSADGNVAVIDLVAVAKATGLDKAMEQELAAASGDLATQVNQIAGNLEKQLQEEQERLGGASAAARRKEFQELATQVRQQLAQSQLLARQKAQQFELGLATRYRAALEPVASQIAREHGASVVLVADTGLLWMDASIDITGEVIASLRANPVRLAGLPPAGAARPDQK